MDSQIPPVEPKAQNASSLNKGLIIGLSAGIVVLLAVVIYLLMAKSANGPEVVNDNQAQNQQPAESGIADWKIYSNQKYGLEFQYPSDWAVPILSDSTTSNGQPSVNLSFLNEPIQIVNDTVFISKSSLDGNILSFVADPKYKDINWEQEFSVGNGKAFYYVNADSKAGPSPTVYLVGANGVWLISTGDVNKKDVLLKIVSTFKFTDQNETAGWKTYDNTKGGYFIKYPSNFRIWGENDLVNYNADDAKYERGNPSGIHIQIQKRNLTEVTYEKEIINLNANIAQGQVNGEGATETKIEKKEIANFTHYNKVLSGPGGEFEIYYAPGNNDKTYFAVLVWGAENDLNGVLAILSTFKFTN